jgi:hypothetical protein
MLDVETINEFYNLEKEIGMINSPGLLPPPALDSASLAAPTPHHCPCLGSRAASTFLSGGPSPCDPLQPALVLAAAPGHGPSCVPPWALSDARAVVAGKPVPRRRGLALPPPSNGFQSSRRHPGGPVSRGLRPASAGSGLAQLA